MREIWSRPTPKGKIEGDLVQAHNQGGSLGGSGPGPHGTQGEVEGELASTPPPPTATAAGGTHPTGMHSCYFPRLVFLLLSFEEVYFSDMCLRLKSEVTNCFFSRCLFQ